MRLNDSRFLILICTLTLFASCASADKSSTKSSSKNISKTVLDKDFHHYFDDCNVDGSITIYDYNNKEWILSDSVDTEQTTLPASTFKIINLLIALETKTIKDENEVVKWVGSIDTVKYGYRPEIYHDMTVKEAFQVSAGWVFVELAKKIGKVDYAKYLKLCNYGNLNLSEKGDDFWNFGAFEISPKNQVKFLVKLYEEKLPFDKKNIQIVKKVMLAEQNPQYTIRAKTGWTRDKGVNIGWWVGYVEKSNDVYFFATRLRKDRNNSPSNFGNCRKEITKAILKELKIID